MREIVISRILDHVAENGEIFDFNGMAVDTSNLDNVSDEDLLDVYELMVGFAG